MPLTHFVLNVLGVMLGNEFLRYEYEVFLPFFFYLFFFLQGDILVNKCY